MRYTFGGGAADFAIQSPLLYNDVVMAAPNRVGTAWSAQSGGVQYSDVVPIGGPTTDANGWINSFQGPDGIAEMWVSFGSNRYLIQAVDAPRVTEAQLEALPVQANQFYAANSLAFSPVGQYVTGQRSLVQAVAAFTSTGSFNPANWRRLTEDLSGVYVTRPTAQGIALVQALIFGGK